jgi:paraquat-inducible protein A
VSAGDEAVDPKGPRVFPSTPRPPLAALRPELLACPECDLLHCMPGGGSADDAETTLASAGRHLECRRCGGLLGLARHRSFDLAAALACTALVTLAIAHLNPVLSIEIQGQSRSATLWQAAWTLYEEGTGFIGLLVLMTTLVNPLLEAAAVCYVLLPLRLGHLAPGAPLVLRAVQAVRPWVMVEVFMLGVLVAFVKLSSLATVVPGAGLWAFAATMLLLTAMAPAFDEEHVWASTAALRRTTRRANA